MRGLSILYIVGYWHLLGYAHGIDHYKNDVTSRLTMVLLGLFIFLSGHLVSRSIGPDFRPRDVWRFYRRRLLRLYPPYLLALVLFQCSGLLQSGQLAGGALLVSALNGNTPRTLWFIAVLMVYLALAPALLLLRQRLNPGRSGRGDLLLVSACLGLDLLLAWHWSAPDPRLFLYLPSFVAGLLSPGPGPGAAPQGSGQLLALAAAGTAVGLPVSFLAPELDERNLAFLPLVLFGSWLVFLLVSRVERHLGQPWWILQLSAASYFLYLFHRPLLKLATGTFSTPLVGPELAYLGLVCLPVSILVAWWGQHLYDRGLAALGGGP